MIPFFFYPSGRTISYLRDAGGRITSVESRYQGESKVLTSGITHLPFGPVTGMRQIPGT